MRKGNFISTYKNIEFYPLDPKEEEIHIEDIAHALAFTCRGNGHVKSFYSVGQHSICCSLEARHRGFSSRVQLGALLHDASEAYISDITRPVKRELGNYLEIEANLQKVIYEAYGLGDLTQEEIVQIKLIDDAMLKYEMAGLMDFYDIDAEKVVVEYDLSFEPMEKVENKFLKLFEELTIKHNI